MVDSTNKMTALFDIKETTASTSQEQRVSLPPIPVPAEEMEEKMKHFLAQLIDAKHLPR